MPPTNFKDVNKKFLQFAIVFSLAVLVLLFAFYFNMRLPILENRIIREKLKPYTSSIHDKEDVSMLIDSIQNYLLRYENARAGEADLLSGRIVTKIPKLKEKINSEDDHTLATLCHNYDQMYSDKKSIRDLREKSKSDSLRIIELQKDSINQSNLIDKLNQRISALSSPK